MIINREWYMPNKWTFQIKPIKTLLSKYINNDKEIWIDPFAGKNSPAKITNDINPKLKTDYNMDAREFIKMFDNEYADGILFDPPYSSSQVKEVYDNIGIPLTQNETTNVFWREMKDEISRVLKKDGIVISCGWNSNGIGKMRGFEIVEILIVSHGGLHNDTIVTVEKKIKNLSMDYIKELSFKSRRKKEKRKNIEKIDIF